MAGIVEQLEKGRREPALQSVPGVEDDHIILVRNRNVRTLAEDIRNGRISIEIAHSVVAYWFSQDERRKWFRDSNSEVKRNDSLDNLRAALTELSA